MQNSQNLILAVVLSLGVLLGFHYFYDKPRAEAARQAAIEAQLKAAPPAATVANAPTVNAPTAATQDRAALVSGADRVKIESPRVMGSLNLKGGQIDDLQLKNYHETPDVKGQPTSPPVTLLTPAGAAEPAQPYYAATGWLADAGVATPTADTVWKLTSGTTLTPTTPVTLTYDNGAGLIFTRQIALDDNFMFTVTDTVASKSNKELSLYPFSMIARHAVPPSKELFILHEGPLGVFNGTLQEISDKKLVEAKEIKADNAAGSKAGWLGLTDKYWLVALVPDAAQPFAARFSASADATPNKEGVISDLFQVDARAPAQTLAPGGTITSTTRIFAGAKEVKLLEAYQEKLQIANFELAVDFGWFYFLTKPYFHALDAIAGWLKDTGYGFGFAILLFTVLLKLTFYPIQSKGYRSMNKMKEVQPRLMELRERWAHDKQRLNQETFEMYRREKVNPASGCWPMLVQIPIFFALYKTLYVTIEMRHAPFPGWIPDLSAPDPTNIFTLFGLIDWTPPHLLHLGIWPMLMGITMALQQQLSPPPGDATQRAVFRWLPLFFMFLLASFPAGLVIYWTWSNLLGIGQQLLLKRKHTAVAAK